MMAAYATHFMLACIVVIAGYLLYTWQHNHPLFDLADLITGDNGKVSLTKFSRACALIVSTWGFASLIQQGKMSEFYFVLYMAVWTGYDVAKLWASKPGAAPKDGP